MTNSKYAYNKVGEVRPANTFDNFEVEDASQAAALAMLRELAAQVVSNQDAIACERYPFGEACLAFLWGKPGRGKTHLVEAFINYIRANAPAVFARMILSRDHFILDYITSSNPYGDAPIVIIDDLFRNKMNVAELQPLGELKVFMDFITDQYDNRRLVIVTSNFSLLGGGIMKRVEEVDQIGRTVSRAQELLSSAGELEIAGQDFRTELARRRKGNGVSLHMLTAAKAEK